MTGVTASDSGHHWDLLGQTVVVETVSGASGTIATGRVVHAAPDGYTIGIGNWTSHVGSPALYALDYDILKDLQPISLLAASPESHSSFFCRASKESKPEK